VSVAVDGVVRRGSVAAVGPTVQGARLSSIDTLAVVLFHVGVRRCALPVSRVRAVVMARPLDGGAVTPDGAVIGVVRDGAVVIPVVDARRWLGVEAPPIAPGRSRWIVLRRETRRLALAVDGVERVGVATVLDPPAVERARVSRYFSLGGALYAEPDVDAIFALAEGATT
jgi:chemotaxis signal transduction protein